ncbi:hypothetical protein BGZ63DRAFT_349451 [Mariannaea sp. PMI_226]|nr:hypothetical protein BGZ63DRAFT_349451 [Mariannaea sp. PMI_226]
MSTKVSFTSAGHLGHALSGIDKVQEYQYEQQHQQQQKQHQQQQQPPSPSSPPQHLAISIPHASASASASAPATQSLVICPDSHRQNHNPSKLPSFRFVDRRASTTIGNRSHSDDNGGLDETVKDDSVAHASPPNNTLIDSQTSPSTSTALSHPSLAYHAPPSPVSPNTDCRGAPVSSTSQHPSADPDPNQPTAAADQTPPLSGSLDLAASDTVLVPPLTLPATAQKLAHPTTHLNDAEKHFDPVPVSTFLPAIASPSAPAPSPTPPSAPSLAAQTSATTSLSSTPSPPLLSSRSRASSCQPESSVPVSAVDPPTHARRPASLPDNSLSQDAAEPPHSTPILTRPRSRRTLVSRRLKGAASNHPPLSLNQERLQAAVEAAQSVQSASQSVSQPSTQSSSDRSSKDNLPGQRDLIPLKTLASSSPPDDRRASVSHRPPVSYRPPVNHNVEPSTSTPVRVPPIRGFRSSGSRKSLTLDMNSRARIFGDDPVDSNYDSALRALEGRSDQDFLTSAARRDAVDGDDTGDVFLKIAREETSRRLPDQAAAEETQSVVSRATRSYHRRPYSSVVPGSKPTSPPQVRRRLSDQQETSRQRPYDDDRASEVSRLSTYRTLAREKAASVHPGEDLTRTRVGASAVRTAPPTPRSMILQDSDNLSHSRRRGGSISDNNSTVQPRASTYRAPGQSKMYNSSPLVRSFDLPRQQSAETTAQGNPEGTESTTSTNAPSTVWDELDDLKSRIHRLELTGKLPPTSGAAISRLSDDRPPTATTTVTTISSSPKRSGNNNSNNSNINNNNQVTTDAVSASSSHRDSHPLLHSALLKSKLLLDAEVFRALEAVANDAMALSSMMGTPGQLGPISSGASTIGSGTNITDRQLRRKADSVCRGLTELCVALGEDRTQTRPPQAVQVQIPAPAQTSNDTPTTPTVNKNFSGASAPQRRQSIGADQGPPKANTTTSPRAMSKFEERRLNILNNNTLPPPRAIASTPSTPLEPVSQRRSSLLISRTRRAGTEEPEDGRKSSLMLRTRRAGTEEPDEGRKTSLFVRNRRGTIGEGDDDQTFRSPSRANTDLNATRTAPLEPAPQPQAVENNTLGSSALPRRRFASSSLNPSRLATPFSTNTPSSRRYLDSRSNNDRDNNAVDRVVEERTQRHMSLGQSMLSRTSSMIRRPARDSNVTITQPSAAAGGYR